MNVTASVSNGVKWLDVNRPGWVEKINLDSLDLSRGRLCILGQIHGSYFYDAMREILPDISSDRDAWAHNRGFDAPEDKYYAALTEEWKRVIRARRNGHSPARLATEAAEEVMFEGSVNIGGTVINLPPTSLAYLTLLVEANR